MKRAKVAFTHSAGYTPPLTFEAGAPVVGLEPQALARLEQDGLVEEAAEAAEAPVLVAEPQEDQP